MPTNTRGHDQITLAGAKFENSGQDLRRKPVDRKKRVPDRPDILRDLREFMLDAIDL